MVLCRRLLEREKQMSKKHSHDWEYCEQSEPHKGRDYYACVECGMVMATEPETGNLVRIGGVK